MNVTYSGFLKEKSILSVTGEWDRAYNGASFFLSWTIVRGRSCCWNLCVYVSCSWAQRNELDICIRKHVVRGTQRVKKVGISCHSGSGCSNTYRPVFRINTLAGLHACDVIDRGCDAWYSKLWLRSFSYSYTFMLLCNCSLCNLSNICAGKWRRLSKGIQWPFSDRS